MFGGSSSAFGQSSGSPFGSQAGFGQMNAQNNNPFAPKPFGSPNPFGSQTGSPMFGSTSTGVFGATQSSSPFSTTPAFGASSTPAFGASTTPTFGSASPSFGGSSVFGQKPAFGGFGSSTATPSSPFGSNLFGSNLFGSSSTPAFGSSTTTPAFGSSTSTPTFGSTPAFGASTPAFGANTTPTPAFGSTNTTTFGNTGTGFGASPSPFGSGGGFGASSTPTFGSSSTPAFGASSTPAFGTSPTPAFGASSTPASAFGVASTPAFGSSTTPSFSFGSSPSFGQTNTTSMFGTGSSPFGTATSSPFGTQSSPFGSQTTTPTFGSSGFGQSTFGAQRVGSRVAPYTATPEADVAGQTPGRLESISAMPAYKDKSHEELRWEDYQQGDKGVKLKSFGQTNTTFTFGTGRSPFGTATSSPFGTQSSPFGSQTTTPTFGSSGFGQSTFGAQRVGSGVAPYTATPEADVAGQTPGRLESISAMPAYKDKSHEELRWEDYQQGDKGVKLKSFGQTNTTSTFGTGRSPFGTATSSPFGTQSSPFGSQTTTPTFGSSGFGQSTFGAQRVGSRVAPYTATPEADVAGQTPGRLESISAMPAYKDKSHDELRWEDYQQGDKGVKLKSFGQANTTSTFGTGRSPFGTATSSPFGTQSSPFGSQTTTPTFGSSGFGQSTFGAQRVGSRVAPYTATPEADVAGQTPGRLESISAMPAYKDKSHEEHRWEDYQQGDKGVKLKSFGQTNTTSTFGTGRSPFGTATSSPFGTQSSPFGSQTTTPTFGSSGFGQSTFGAQRVGSGVAPYTATPEADVAGQTPGRLESISAMPAYKDKSHEELRWEDYQQGDKGGPNPAGQSTSTIGFGSSPAPAANPFASSSTFNQTSPNPFSTPSTSSPFGAKPSPFGSTGFGTTTSGFNSSGFGTTNISNPFGAPSAAASSPFSTPSSTPFGSNTSIFGTTSSSAFGSSPSLFGSAPAQGSTPSFASGLNFLNSSSSQPFQSTTPSIGTGGAFTQTGLPFGQTSTASFGQTSLFNTPSTFGGGNLFSSSTSLFGQTTPSLSTPFSAAPSTQTNSAFGFGNLNQTQPGIGAFGGGSGMFGQNAGQLSATQSPAVMQPATVTNPFGLLPAMPQISIGHNGISPSIQYGISTMPVVDKPTQVRISSLLTSRHLSQRRTKLPARKYHSKKVMIELGIYRPVKEIALDSLITETGLRRLIKHAGMDAPPVEKLRLGSVPSAAPQPEPRPKPDPKPSTKADSKSTRFKGSPREPKPLLPENLSPDEIQLRTLEAVIQLNRQMAALRKMLDFHQIKSRRSWLGLLRKIILMNDPFANVSQ